MGSKSRQRGKNHELACCRFWGMKRAHFEAHDLEGHPVLSVEAKSRQSDLKTVRTWIEQARAAAPKNRTPVVHFHVNGHRRGEDLVIMYANDLRDIVGKGDYYNDE